MAREIGVGIDVAKDTIAVASSDGSFEGSFKTTPAQLLKCAEKVKELGPVRVVVEATGGYEKPVLAALYGAGTPVVLIQPNRARHYAKALSTWTAKTDAKDAEVLAEMGAGPLRNERLWEPRSETEETLRSLVARRDHVVQVIEDETKRKRGASELAVESIERVLTFLRKERGRIEAEIAEVLKLDADLRERSERLCQTNGVGFVTAVVLLSYMPELGKMSRSQAVALAGLAAWNRDSGEWKGQRFIGGGRARVRSAMYMAVMGARRSNEELNRLYDRLIAKGKAPKVGKIACARKLLIHLNSEMKRYYAEKEAALQQ